MHRAIMHVDIDAFFASVEQVLNPALRGRAVIVGGRPDDRSVVASASYEARDRGVRTAMPIAQAYRLCPDGVFLRGTFADYRRASEQVFAICRDFTPAVEPSSIDEGYLDMTGTERLWSNADRGIRNPGFAVQDGSRVPLSAFRGRHARAAWIFVAAVALRSRVLRKTGLHVSIGIGTNKLIARMATDLAKPNGIAQVFPGHESEFLAPMPVDALPGIGPRTAEQLAQASIRTVADLRRVPVGMLEHRFGVVGRELADRALGRDSRPVLTGPADRRSISRESSFERDEPDRDVALAMLHYLTERAAWALRRERLRCRRIAAKLRYNDFSTLSASSSLSEPTDQEAVLFARARQLFDRLDTHRLTIRLVGVCLEQLVPAEEHQMHLFEEEAIRRRQCLTAAQDAIRRRHGFSSLVTGQSIGLLGRYEQDDEGFKLRTSCLTK